MEMEGLPRQVYMVVVFGGARERVVGKKLLDQCPFTGPLKKGV